MAQLRLAHITVLVLLGVLVTLSGIFSYWNLEGLLFNKPVDVKEVIFQTTKNVYKNGELVSAAFTLCKNTMDAALVQWSLVDTELKSYPSRVVETGKVGCYDKTITEIEKLPLLVADGLYYFTGVVSYQVNPVHVVKIPMRSNEFRIDSTLNIPQ